MKLSKSFRSSILLWCGLNPIVEHHNSKGRSDLEVKVGARYWVFEFKVCNSENDGKELLQKQFCSYKERNTVFRNLKSKYCELP